MEQNPDTTKNQRFSSRWGFILSVIGIAVGTGNIWRFPRIAAKMGGSEGAGAFLIAWIIMLFLWGIPLIIAEYAIGRRYRTGVVGAFIKTAGEKFAWMGAFVTFVATAITFFYSVILGWCLYYFVYTLFNTLPATTEAAQAAWDSYQSGGWPLVSHAVIMGLGALAIRKGVTSIERVNKVLIPCLLCILLFSVIRALTMEGAFAGISYLFTPEWHMLARPNVWIEGLTQNAWDIGAGWGLYLTYAAYMKRGQSVVKNAFATGICNNTVSLLAGLMVFGTVFSVLQTELHMTQPQILNIMRQSGEASTGLTFIWMPQLFARMALGHPMAVLFFLGLTFAGFTSLIAQLELPARVFIDAGVKRAKAIFLVVGVSYLLGIPSALSLNILTNQDYVWGVALMLSGAFVAVAVIRHGPADLRKEELHKDPNDWKIGAWWDIVFKYFIPVGALVLLVWLTWTATLDSPDQWYNPFQTFSVMTCLLQWLFVLAILFMLNRWLVSRTVQSDSLTE